LLPLPSLALALPRSEECLSQPLPRLQLQLPLRPPTVLMLMRRQAQWIGAGEG
jgi:hypothetical protein